MTLNNEDFRVGLTETSPDEASMPGLWRTCWLFWMQPVTLSRILRSHGIHPLARWHGLWKLGKNNPHAAVWLRNCVAMLFCVMPLIAVTSDVWAAATGVHLRWQSSAIVIGVAVFTGVFFGATDHVVDGVVWGVAWGVANGVVRAVGGGVGGGVLYGVVLGLAMGVSIGVDRRGAFVAVVVGTFGMVVAGAFGALVAWAFGAAFISSYLRIPISILEVLGWKLSAILIRLGLRGPRLRLCPVLFHELSSLPIPGIWDELVAEYHRTNGDVSLIRRVLAACEIAPGQRRLARDVWAEFWSLELNELAESGQWAPIAELRGTWLPNSEVADASLLLFRDVARQVRGARLATSAYYRVQLLERAIGSLDRRNWPSRPAKIKTAADTFRTMRFPEVVERWSSILGKELEAARREAREFLMNPFIAGNSLQPGENGEMLLRGRDAAVRDLSNILANPTGGTAVVLLAPRRTGKTSLLQLLPVRLPDALSVFFDLQDNPCNSAQAFFRALGRAVAAAAARDGRLTLPPLGESADIEAAAAWFDAMEKSPGDLRILICIDEFERLEELWPPDHRRELLQLMGLFRATIQHRRKVRLLVAGVAPFDELGSMWFDHFINARQIHLDFLTEADTIGLLTKPVPEFPSDAIPVEIARRIFQRTAGQPYLVQLYGWLLVQHVNYDRDKRRIARLDDLAPVEERLLGEGAIYFGQCYRAPEPFPNLMLAMAKGEAPELTHRQEQWLQRRGFVVTGERRLRVPVFARWILREEGCEPSEPAAPAS